MRFADAFALVTADLLAALGHTDPAMINRGNCDEWANRMQSIVGGRAMWLDSIVDVDLFPIDDMPCVAHCVLEHEGRWYDSEHPNGVEHVLVLAGFDEDTARTLNDLVVPFG